MGPPVKVRMVLSSGGAKEVGFQFGQMAKVCRSLVTTEYEKGLARDIQKAYWGSSEVLLDPGGPDDGLMIWYHDREMGNHDWALLEGKGRRTRTRKGTI